MKKIGIITFYKNNNYGANIQAFALNRYLRELGHKALEIYYFYKGHENLTYNYRNMFKNIVKKTPKSKLLKEIIVFLLYHKKNYPYIEAFENFRKEYIPETKPCKNADSINSHGFDTVVIGSDQVWNTDITKGLDKVYFGDGLSAEKKITYGVSIGEDRFYPQYENEIKKYAESLSAVSVREINSRDYLREFLKRDVCLVLDPVFLFGKEFYEKLSDKSKINIKDRYILIYKMSDFPFVYEMAEYLREKTGFRLVEVSVKKAKRKGVGLINNAGPADFINLIKNAEYVVTNSFHGTALSMILKKEFYVSASKRPGRIDTLLQLGGISHRKISDLNEIDLNRIDYNLVADNMAAMIEKSKEFLDKNI